MFRKFFVLLILVLAAVGYVFAMHMIAQARESSRNKAAGTDSPGGEPSKSDAGTDSSAGAPADPNALRITVTKMKVQEVPQEGGTKVTVNFKVTGPDGQTLRDVQRMEVDIYED